MERCIHKLYNYVLTTDYILTTLQSDFVSGDSATFSAAPYIPYFLCEASDNGKEVQTAFCDTSKAYDRAQVITS